MVKKSYRFFMTRTGRPRAFDEATVLAKARDLFWAQGYGATSIEQLVDSLSLQRGSLYGAFGDKRALYLRAVQLYATENRDRLVSMLETADEVLPVLRRILVAPATLNDPDGRPPTRGCLVGNTTAELVPFDDEARELVSSAFDGFLDSVSRALARAQERGEVTTAASPQSQAQMLLVLFQGSALIARADNGDRQRIIGGIDAAIDGMRAVTGPGLADAVVAADEYQPRNGRTAVRR
ncbi:TetR family transcriptional regulator [Microbacterium sp. X-17]|uniref:TetR/AcrR family transcriptional regulator n=1 Tax=Microbacterium sp. X-17 TaxID=3144404 RepID=UPI0031F4DF28